MRHIALLSLILTAAAPGATRADGHAIGLAAPLSGPSALLGEQMRDGAEAAAQAVGQTLVVQDDACSGEGGAAAARALIAADVAAVAGFLCTEAIEAALPLLKAANIPVIATGVRTNALTDRRDKTGWPVVRLAPRADAETAAAIDLIGALWRDQLFAVVDDGTIYARDLAEGFRLGMEQQNLRPVFVDTFRPQLDNQVGLVGRLRKAGATHLFAVGDRADLAIIGRDAAGLGYRLTVAGGEVLRAPDEAVPLAEGTLMVGLPEWPDAADADVVAELRSRGIEPEGYVLPAYAAVEIAAEAVSRARATGATTLSMLEGEEFQTVLGPIGFEPSGDRSDNPYRLFRWQDGKFVQLD